MTIEAVSAPSQQLIDAIQATIDQGDGRWISSYVGGDLKGIVLSRAKELNQQIDRAIRLAIVLNACDRHGYMHLMYVKISRIRVESMYQFFLAAAQAGHLTGMCEFSKERKDIKFNHDGPLSFFGKSYTITFGQMPLAMAMLDFLHNSLGFGGESGIGSIVQNIRREDVPGTVDEACLALRSELKAWLDERMQGTYPLRQARALRNFLEAFSRAKVRFHIESTESKDRQERVSIELKGEAPRTYDVEDWHRRRWEEGYLSIRDGGAIDGSYEAHWDRSYAELIDDEAILFFWEIAIQSKNIDAGQIGVLMYRSAANAMLDYRQALLLSDLERAGSKAVSLVAADGRAIEILDARSQAGSQAKTGGRGEEDLEDLEEDDADDDRDASSLDAADPQALKAIDGDTEVWHSPLSYFLGGQKLSVNWLPDTTFETLSAFMGSEDVKDNLFGGLKPNALFARTLARYICFGDLQRQCIKSRTFRSPRVDVDEYEVLSKWCGRRRQSTLDLVYATVHGLLLQKRHAPAIALLLRLEPDLIAQTLGKPVPALPFARLLEMVADRLLAGSCEAGMRMKAGSDATNRVGFPKHKYWNDEFTDELVEGSDYVFDLHREIAQMSDGFEGIPNGAYGKDARRFSAILAGMYGQDR